MQCSAWPSSRLDPRSYWALKKEGKKQSSETTGAESRNEMKLGGEATRETKGSSEKNLESFSCNESCLGLEADCDALEADTRNAQDSRTGGQCQMIINANPSSEMKDSSSSGPGRMKEKRRWERREKD